MASTKKPEIISRAIVDCRWLDRAEAKIGVAVMPEAKEAVKNAASHFGSIRYPMLPGRFDFFLYVHGTYDGKEVGDFLIRKGEEWVAMLDE